MTLLREMVREEWRMHARLFGGRAFAAFPLLVMALTAATAYGLARLGIGPGAVAYGMHHVAFFFGLNVGTVGFVGREALENLLGEASLLVFSARTLPVSRRRILVTFLVKDLLYYVALFVLPAVLGLLPAATALDAPIAGPVLLIATVGGAFMLGVALSFTAATLYLRGVLPLAAGAVLLAAATAAAGPGILAFTPLAFYRAPAAATLVTGFLPIPLIAAAGVLLFRPAHRVRFRTAGDLFPRVDAALPFDRTGIVAKSVLDMSRSSGGAAKL
ncbi:MAG: hypothetical protein ABEK12_01980, partial [Candidatus Nanohaloarchaea archaeon]